MSGFARILLNFTVYGLLGAFVTALVAYILVLESRPDLSVWHLADLDEEFTTKSDISDFNQYLALEDAILQKDVLETTKQGAVSLNRTLDQVNVDDVDDTMDTVRDGIERGEEIGNILAESMGGDFDAGEMELLHELAMLNEEDGDVVAEEAAPSLIPAAPSPGTLRPIDVTIEVPSIAGDSEVIATLQKELA